MGFELATFKLNDSIWVKILDKIDDFYTICKLALSDEYFAKLIGMNFKQVAQANKLYRFPGESWSTAVLDLHNRLWNNCLQINYYQVQLTFGVDTDRFCFTGINYVIVSSLDFSKPYLHYFHVGFVIYRTHIVENGKYLAVMSPNFQNLVKVFDLDAGEEVSPEVLQQRTFNEYLLFCRGGIVTDVLSQKEAELDLYYMDKYADPYGKYVMYMDADGNLTVRNFETDEDYHIRNYDKAFSTKFLVESGCVLIQYYKLKTMEIHHVDSKRIIYSEDIVEIWKVMSGLMILNDFTGQFLVFDHETCSWAYSKSLCLNPEVYDTVERTWQPVKNLALLGTLSEHDRIDPYADSDDSMDSIGDPDEVDTRETLTEAMEDDDDSVRDSENISDALEPEVEDVKMLFFNVKPNHEFFNKKITAKARRPHPFVSLHKALQEEAKKTYIADEETTQRMRPVLHNWINETQRKETGRTI